MMPPAATPGGVIHSIGMSTAIQTAARMAPVMSQILPVEVVSAVWSEMFGESDIAAIPSLNTWPVHLPTLPLGGRNSTVSCGARWLLSRLRDEIITITVACHGFSSRVT